MTNEVAIRQEGGVSTDALALGRLQDSVERLYGAIERDGRPGAFVDRLPALPSHELRTQMHARRIVLHSAIRPISMARAEQETARKAIAALLGGYLNIKTDNPSAVAAGYVAHLAEQPLFAILQACDDFKHRRVVDRVREDETTIYFTLDHAPSAFRLLDQVKKCAAAARSEHYKIGRVLTITKTVTRPASPEQAAHVGGLLRRLADSLATGNELLRKEAQDKIRAEAQEARDRAARIIQD